MTWNQRYRLASYIRSSLWVIPIAAVALAQLSGSPIRALDAWLGWSGLGFGLDGAKALVGAVVTLSLSFLVFTFGSLLVAIQVASGQYTPRIIATTLLSNNVIRWAVGLFVFTFLFSVKAQNRLETTVPQLVVFLAGFLGWSCITIFLFLIDYAARLLRPVSLVRCVGQEGRAVVESVYPEKLDGKSDESNNVFDPDQPKRTVLHNGTSAIIVAVNTRQLVAAAKKTGGVIQIIPQVGDFVATDDPLFELHGAAASLDDRTLQGMVAFGSERTMEQDPLFAFRILVDIAIKALSAAINDPTTAVLAIDQLHRLLRNTGRRNLRTDAIRDDAGDVRVILRTPNWEDFVHLAFCEIRYYGASNLQIARRLRAMILNLTETLPAKREPALRTQLALLDQTIDKVYLFPEDHLLARIPDTQGLGASSHILAKLPLS
jgi:uncharacterized membrane protein